MFSLNIQFSFWIEVVYGRSLLAALREANIAPHRGKEGWGMSAGRLQVPPDHAYGIKCIGSDTTVGDCLRGWYSEEEQKAEPDLGKCIKV